MLRPSIGGHLHSDVTRRRVPGVGSPDVSMHSELPTSGGPDPFDDIELCLEADLGYLPVLRAVATDLARHVGFGADELADFRVAVDEVCSTLIAGARPATVLTCLFRVLDNEVRMSAQVAAEVPANGSHHSFGRQLLSLLVDGCATNAVPAPSGGFVISTDIVKRSMS